MGARGGILINPRTVNSGSAFSNRNINVSATDSQRPIFGPTFELGIKNHFAIEFGPTYRRQGVTSFVNIDVTSIPQLPPEALILETQFSRQTLSTWDLPVLGKYYFGRKQARIRPFIGLGGGASRHSSSIDSYTLLQTGGGESRTQSFRLQRVNWGFTPIGGAGVSIRSGRFSIVPEFRYLRDARFSYPGVRDRAEIFLGFRF